MIGRTLKSSRFVVYHTHQWRNILYNQQIISRMLSSLELHKNTSLFLMKALIIRKVNLSINVLYVFKYGLVGRQKCGYQAVDFPPHAGQKKKMIIIWSLNIEFMLGSYSVTVKHHGAINDLSSVCNFPLTLKLRWLWIIIIVKGI